MRLADRSRMDPFDDRVHSTHPGDMPWTGVTANITNFEAAGRKLLGFLEERTLVIPRIIGRVN
jgi:hypothetical protein